LESDVLRDIYREKESLESFLFNESNKINRTVIKLIMGKWAILESRLIESILENEKSKAKINELKIENIKLENKNKVIPTYARIFDDGSSGTSKTQPVDLKNKKEVILIRPIKDDDKISNDELRVNVTRALDKIKSKLKVRSIRQISRGGLVIEVDSTRDKELIEAAKLDKIGLKLEEPKRVKPSLIIYDVEKEFRAEELKQQLLWKNIDNVTEGNYNEISKEVEFRHCFNTKNSNRVNWIVQLNGDLWKQLVAKAKVYMNWRVHNIKEYINVVRCFKCHGYEHIAKFCNQDDLCEKCGEKGHIKASCQRAIATCVNCRKAKRKTDQHPVRSLDCPEYLRHVELYKNKIKWS